MEYKHITHGFEPVFNEHSRILILGSLPSVRSREQQFYYGHPQNRFWKLIAEICGCEAPKSITDKRRLLLSNGIALWDVISECDIIGSSDASLKNIVPADLSVILSNADIKALYANGSAAAAIFDKHIKPLCGREIIKLPSTSPANAAWSFEKLLTEWGAIRKYLDKCKQQ